MVSRRRLVALFGQALVISCGAGAVLCWSGALYANACVLALLAVWIGTLLAWRAGQPPPRPVAPLPSSDSTAAESERRMLSSLIDQSPAPLLLQHADGALRAGNRAARRLFSTDDLLANPPEALATALRDSAPGERHVARLELGAGLRSYALSVADVTGPRGSTRLAALVDIQAEIQAAEAAALRDLLQVLSHEIMNSLTPVASLAATAEDLLADETSEAAVLARDAVSTLARRAQGLTRFVEAYRSLARLPPPTLAPTSLTELVDEAARLFRSRWRAQGLDLRLHRPAPDIVMRLDFDLLSQALVNLLCNAAEAALEGGAEAPFVALGVEPGVGGGATLTVEDNGPGVRLDNPDAIFRPFFTTKATGTGVGLSLARQVALAHGGDVTVAPYVVGEGARFTLAL